MSAIFVVYLLLLSLLPSVRKAFQHAHAPEPEPPNSSSWKHRQRGADDYRRLRSNGRPASYESKHHGEWYDLHLSQRTQTSILLCRVSPRWEYLISLRCVG